MGPWSGILSLLTRSVLCLAVVGAVCRTGNERVWWLGFATFGWVYLGFPFSTFYHSQGAADAGTICCSWITDRPTSSSKFGFG